MTQTREYSRLLVVMAVAVFTVALFAYATVVLQQFAIWILYAIGLTAGYVVGRWDRSPTAGTA